MTVFRRLGVAPLAVLGVLSLSATSLAQEPKGTLIFAVESLAAQTLDPILEGRPGNAVYQAPMYDSLVGFDLAKGGLGPGVAERWAMSEDGLSWTFYLRAGQVCHNGDPLTAADVKFSIARQMSPQRPCLISATTGAGPTGGVASWSVAPTEEVLISRRAFGGRGAPLPRRRRGCRSARRRRSSGRGPA